MSSVGVHSVYDFTELKSCLQETLNKKRGDRGLSMSGVSRKLGLRSRASLSLILTGKRLPSRDTLAKVAEYLELGTEEGEYLHALLDLELVRRKKRRGSAGADNEEQDLLKKLRAFSSAPFDQVTLKDAAFSYIADWYHLPLKELVGTKGFRWNLAWIRRRLRNKVTEDELFRSMKLMLKLGILERDPETGKLSCAIESVTTTEDVPSQAIRKHHRQMMERAAESLEEQLPAAREISSVTIAFDSRRLAEAKRAVNRFRERFRRRFVDAGGDSVFQLNVQLFEHTDPPPKPSAPTSLERIEVNRSGIDVKKGREN